LIASTHVAAASTSTAQPMLKVLRSDSHRVASSTPQCSRNAQAAMSICTHDAAPLVSHDDMENTLAANAAFNTSLVTSSPANRCMHRIHVQF